MNRNWVRRAIQLSWFTIAYNLVEGVVSIGFGLSDDSFSLAGFGMDSLIEVASAVLVLWRFQGEHGRNQVLSVDRERKATLGIGLLFLLLASITGLVSGWQLFKGNHPETTLPGLIIAALSLSFMFFLWDQKKKAARALNSSTMEKDANCSLACIKLSLILFLGSLLFILVPSLWWTDSVAALLIAILIAREGWETVQSSKEEDFQGGCGCAH